MLKHIHHSKYSSNQIKLLQSTNHAFIHHREVVRELEEKSDDLKGTCEIEYSTKNKESFGSAFTTTALFSVAYHISFCNGHSDTVPKEEEQSFQMDYAATISECIREVSFSWLFNTGSSLDETLMILRY